MRPSGVAIGLELGVIFGVRSSYTSSPVSAFQQRISPGSAIRYRYSPTKIGELPAALVVLTCHLTCVLLTSPLPVGSTAVPVWPPRPASAYNRPAPYAGEEYDTDGPRQNHSRSPVSGSRAWMPPA